ncbi:MAG: hypothetical protein LZF61_06395 [Nitrosomonas sp.]|nr:MAG: hypothetical protein LZF61_06395 [Nitrosomonas sp.]
MNSSPAIGGMISVEPEKNLIKRPLLFDYNCSHMGGLGQLVDIGGMALFGFIK